MCWFFLLFVRYGILIMKETSLKLRTYTARFFVCIIPLFTLELACFMKSFLLESETQDAVSVDTLNDFGVLYWHFDVSGGESTYSEPLEALCKERNYKNRDQV